jgi:FtsH-binding integral membrane protein
MNFLVNFAKISLMSDYSFDLSNSHGASGSSFVEKEKTFVAKVFNWMFLGLLASAAVAFLMSSNPLLMKALYSNNLTLIVLGVGTLALVWNLSANIQKMSPSMAAVNFFIYAALNGVLLSSIFIIYTAQSIFSTFLIASTTFGITAIYGATTKKDLTKLGSYLIMGLIGLVITSVVNMFLNSTGLASLINYAGVVLFVGLTAYDMQKIKELGQTHGYNPNFAILSALTLYLDFVNLFIYLLRILGDRRDR